MSLDTAIAKAFETNPEGFTLNAEGEMVNPKRGYAVAVGEYKPEDKPEYVGGWTDEKTGTFYLDSVIILNRLRDAVKLGKRFNQLAIWDFGKQKEIRLD